MSNLITEAFVQQYKDNVLLLSQQKGSKLRDKVRLERVVGKQHFFERLGATAAVKKTTRHGDTPLVNSPHSRRMVTLVDYEWADLVDQQDKIRLLIRPESEYAINAAWAIGRSIDDEIITAFNGTAKAGETGGTDVALPAGQVIAHGSAKFTLSKLRQAKRKQDDADVEEEGRQIVIAPAALEDLLEDTNVTSSDFNTVKALVQGEIDTYLGYKFTRSTRLPKTGNIRSCFAWHPNAMGLALGMDLVTKIAERIDKSFAVQVYVAATGGATRIEDEGVVQIDYDETL